MLRNELIGVALDQNGYYKDIADMLKKVSLRLKRKNRVKKLLNSILKSYHFLLAATAG